MFRRDFFRRDVLSRTGFWRILELRGNHCCRSQNRLQIPVPAGSARILELRWCFVKSKPWVQRMALATVELEKSRR